MKKIGLLLTVGMVCACLIGCKSSNNKDSNTTTTNSSVENITKENSTTKDTTKETENKKEELIQSSAKVTVITVTKGEELKYFASEDAIWEDFVQGYVVSSGDNEMVIEECNWVQSDDEPNGFRIDHIGNTSLELADEVEIWGLYTTCGVCYIKMPFEDLKNYEKMVGHDVYWNFYKNSDGKVCMIIERYIP